MNYRSPSCKILIFFIMTLVPVLMPLFIIPESPAFTEWTFPYQRVYLAMLGFILIILNPELRKAELHKIENEENKTSGNTENESPKKSLGFIKKFLFAAVTFLVLFLISFILQKIGNLISHKPLSPVIKPSDPQTWFYCILNFLLSAFYEESLYRFFIPEALIFLTRNFKDKKMIQTDCEIISCMLFALGHVYLGFLSVINAALAYVVLRICFKKTNSLVPGTLSHFAYNLFQLMLM